MTTIITFTVKLGIAGLNAAKLTVRGRAHAAALAANVATYANPIPTVVLLLAKCDEVEAADIAVQNNGGKQDYLIRNERMRELRAMIKELGGYVQAVSNGDPEKIALAGFAVKANSEPVGPMPAPKNLIVRITDMPGELEVRWGGTRGRMTYIAEMCQGDPLVEANWKQYAIQSRNFFIAQDLTSHVAYSFRVSAVGAVGRGPVSDIGTAKPL